MTGADLMQRRAHLRAVIADERARRARDDTPTPVVPPRRWTRARDLVDEAPPESIIEDLAWPGSITMLIGESGAGKTFVGLDLGAAVCDAATWHGRHVQPGAVVYVAYEGTLRLRVRALLERGGRSLDHMYAIDAREPLSPRLARDGSETPSRGELLLIEDLAAIAAEATQPIRLIVIDTARGSMTGSEDSSEHVAAYLRAVARVLATVPGAAAIVVHHAGWQDGETRRRRERGSSAWRGQVDGTVYLECAAEHDRETQTRRLVLTWAKVREGEIPPPLHLVRRRVDLIGMDRHGQPITSCIIERDSRTRADREAEQARAAEAEHRGIDFRVLSVLRDHAETARSRDSIRAVVGLSSPTVQASIARILQAGWALPPERQRQPYRVTEAGLQALTTVTPTTPTESDSTPTSRAPTDYDPPPYRGGRGRTQSGAESDRESESDSPSEPLRRPTRV